MLGTISTVGGGAFAFEYFQPLMERSSGVSQESRALQKAVKQVVSKSREAVSFRPAENSLVSRLWELAAECREADWNGYEAAPISISAIEQAAEFIRSWPMVDDLPDCAPEPDGSVNLEWIYTKNRRVAVSLDGSPRLAFAWLDGADKGRGVAVFQNGRVPLKIVESVREMRER